jgi:hypothetical protein
LYSGAVKNLKFSHFLCVFLAAECDARVAQLKNCDPMLPAPCGGDSEKVKEVKGPIDVKEVKEPKDAKDVKDIKGAKDVKEPKDAKDAKNVKGIKGAKDVKEVKENKDNKKVGGDATISEPASKNKEEVKPEPAKKSVKKTKEEARH